MKYEDYLLMDFLELKDRLEKTIEVSMFEVEKQVRDGNKSAGKRARKMLYDSGLMLKAFRKRVTEINLKLKKGAIPNTLRLLER